MAHRANANPHVSNGRATCKAESTADAMDCRIENLGMNLFFHDLKRFTVMV